VAGAPTPQAGAPTPQAGAPTPQAGAPTRVVPQPTKFPYLSWVITLPGLQDALSTSWVVGTHPPLHLVVRVTKFLL